MSIRSFIYVLWCFAGLAFGGYYFRHALNADAVAYLRIAEYYANGQWNLAVSGYWGPMISWLMVPFFKFGVAPLVAARIVMAFSALVFIAGCWCVFRVFQLPGPWKTAGMILASIAAMHWSTVFITPDLLLSGLIAMAASCLIIAFERKSVRLTAGAGALWGVAYLAKAVAFPLAVLTIGVFGFRQWRRDAANHSQSIRQILAAMLAFAFVAGPWATTLSFKYGKPTFSTTAAISHTLTGPTDVDRYHPFAREFHRPEAGRITSWEEPSRMPYRYWSPFENADYALHQLRVLARNLLVCSGLLLSLNPAMVFLVPAFMRRRGQVEKASVVVADPAATLIVPALLLLIYLPCYVTLTEQRFFYPAFPFLFCALYRCGGGWLGPSTSSDPSSERGKLMLAAASIGASLALVIAVTNDTPKVAGEYAVDLASRIQRAGLAGPIAGSGMLPGGRSGLFVAYLIRQLWYGDELSPSSSSFANSGARLAVVLRASRLREQLDNDPRFRNCDDRLFEREEVEWYPLSIYEVVAGSAVPTTSP